MTKQRNAEIETRFHDDGAVSAHVTLADGTKHVLLVKKDHPLTHQFVARGIVDKARAAINSATADISAADKLAALEKAWDEGRWTMQEGTAKPKGSALVRALAALKGVPIEEAEAYAKGLSKAEQATLRAVPAVAAKILELEATERNAAAGDLLSGFLTPPTEEQQEAA